MLAEEFTDYVIKSIDAENNIVVLSRVCMIKRDGEVIMSKHDNEQIEGNDKIKALLDDILKEAKKSL